MNMPPYLLGIHKDSSMLPALCDFSHTFAEWILKIYWSGEKRQNRYVLVLNNWTFFSKTLYAIQYLGDRVYKLDKIALLLKLHRKFKVKLIRYEATYSMWG